MEFRSNTCNPDFDRTIPLDANGNFSLADIPRDSYSLRVKGSKWLAQANPVDVTMGNVTNFAASLLTGDVNNDNSCDATDFGIFVSAYNSSASRPGSGYDIRADFNGDGSVDATDFGLFVGNYNTQGDP